MNTQVNICKNDDLKESDIAEAIEEHLPTQFNLDKLEYKSLRTVQKQLKTQLTDLLVKRNHIETSIKEVGSVLSSLDKIFGSK